MRILIVHAHHEPKSFSSALARRAAETLQGLGHTVELADLYAEKFNPVSDRRSFSSVKDPNYLKQQVEEWRAMQLSTASAKLLIYQAFIEEESGFPKHLARRVHELYFQPVENVSLFVNETST